MTNSRLTKAVFIVLVMAMLSMQWSKNHIHLTEYHDHGGSQHHHTIGAHTHQSLTQNDNVVELDNHCNLHKWNSVDDQSIALTSAINPLSLIASSASVETSTFCNSKRRYIDYSTLHLRAPPKLS